MGVCNCSMFCCTLLYVHSSIAIILMGKRELVDFFNLSSWCLVMVEWLFLAVPWGCLRFVIVVFPDHTHYFFRFYSKLWVFMFKKAIQSVDLRLIVLHIGNSYISIDVDASGVIDITTMVECSKVSFVHINLKQIKCHKYNITVFIERPPTLNYPVYLEDNILKPFSDLQIRASD